MSSVSAKEEGALLTGHEAEYIVDGLKHYGLEEVGSMEWLRQHNELEKLNLQAHYNTIAHLDDFIMSGLISYGKMGLLIHELLAIEIWKEKVLPHIFERLTTEASTITLSLVVYHEATIVSLFEVILFHQEACEALDSDALLELGDYCCRKMIYLNTRASIDVAYKEKNAKDYINMKVEEEMEEKARSVRFSVGVSSLTILRYLTDYINDLPPSVMARLLDTNDVLMTLIPLIENPPWERQRKRKNINVIEKFIDGKWMEVSLESRFKLTKPDAQVWLALNNLLVDPKSRSRYNIDNFRRDQILKLRKYLNELLIDQLPILKDLLWVLEELAIKIPPTSLNNKTSRLILEQVPEIRQKLLHQSDWESMAHTHLVTILSISGENETTTQQQLQEMLKIFEFGEMLEARKCVACGSFATQRCSQCKSEWYCGRNCQVSVWKMHKKVCNILTNSNIKTQDGLPSNV